MRICATVAVVLTILQSTFAEEPSVLFSASHSAALVNGDACVSSDLSSHPVTDLGVATNPYVLPEYVLSLRTDDYAFDAPFTVEVTFVDEGAGIVQARIVECEKPLVTMSPSRQGSYTRLNTGGLRSAWFEFPAISHVADATLRIGNLQHLHAVRIWPVLPGGRWDEIKASVPHEVTAMATLARPMQLVTTAGVDVRGEWDSLASSLDAMRELAPLAKVLGFTSIESYVTWKRIELAEGEFDFRFYDAIVETLHSYGLQWSPLVIVGSAYALPRHVTRVLQAFGAHYDGKGILESVRLGPSGNFGESQYPAGGNWGIKGHAMHIHIGWWSGDTYARADFAGFLRGRSADVETLNKAWQTDFTSFEAVEMVLPETMYVKQRRLDFTEWYTDSMSAWCDWWVQEAGKAMPHTKLYQSAGGWGFREAGTDYTAQAKSMIAVDGGIRLTNETDSYEQDFYATRLAATAARLYGIDLGFEPASSHTARGVVGRIYNTTATDGDHLFTYHSNVMSHPMSVARWLESLSVLDTRQAPIVDVAVYYPETMNQLDDAAFRHLYAWGFNSYAREVRRVVDVDYLDERLIREGFLDRYKVLVFAWAGVIERDVEECLDAWVREGGVIVYPSFPRGPMETVDGDTSTFAAWERGDTGSGAYYRFVGDMEPPSLYGEFVRSVLLGVPQLQPWVRIAVEARHPEQVFLTVQEDGHVLVLNYNDEAAPLELPGQTPVTLPPYSIARVHLPEI